MIEKNLNKNTPFFSIIIPTYNSAKELNGALDSITAQDESYEILIIDGLSTDDTVSIANQYESNIKIISEPDKGVYDAMNKGLDTASGTLIGILGSDDRYLPGVFTKIKDKYIGSYSEIVYGLSNMIQVNGDVQLRKDENYGFGALISGIPFGHNSMFASQKAYKIVGKYDLKYEICSDANWVHRAIKLGIIAISINEPVVNFSLNGLSSNNAEKILSETYKVIASNFHSIDAKDAKVLIDAVRGWGEIEPAIRFSRKYNYDHLLRASIHDVFG